MASENELRAFGGLVVRVQQGGELSREEAHHAFDQIWSGAQPPIQQGVFLEALRSRGPTADEMAGFISSFEQAWFRHNPGAARTDSPHLMVCGVGTDTLKTVNISSGASVLAAACGLPVHKICAPGMTGVSGSHDVFAQAGFDPNSSHAATLQALRETGFGVSSVVGEHSLPVGHVPVLANLRCATVLHIGGPMSRYTEDELHKVVGVPRPELGVFVCAGLQAAGFSTAQAPCGSAVGLPDRHMDEYSNAGPTQVTALGPEGIRSYEVHPEDAGLRVVPFEEIAAAPTREENIGNMLGVIEGRHEDGPVLELLALNAAAMLEQMGRVDSLAAGVEAAREAVASGRAAELLAASRAVHNGTDG